MDVTLSAKMAEYYEKLMDLQDKLRRSEEERLKLEMKFSEIIQVTREEEQLHYRKLRHQYKIFLEEDRKRQERNEKIVKTLEKIDARISRLTSKTNLYQRPRRFCRNCHHRTCCQTTNSQCLNDIQKSEKNETTFPKYEEYEKESTTKLDIIDEYLNSLKKNPTSLPKTNKTERINTSELDNLKAGLNKRFDSNKANSIATEIMNSIYSRHYERDPLDPKKTNISQPIPNIPKILCDETEKTSHPSLVSSKKCSESVVPKEVPNFLPEISIGKFHDSENETRNGEVHNPRHDLTNGHVAHSSKPSPLNLIEENINLKEEESKIALELNCSTKENDLVHQDGTNRINLEENDAEKQLPERITDTERNEQTPSNIQVALQQESSGNESTTINPSEPNIKDERLHDDLHDLSATQINNNDQPEQHQDPQTIQTIDTRSDGQSVDDHHLVPPTTVLEEGQRAGADSHHEPQYDPNSKYEAQYDEYGQVIQQNYDQTGEHVDQYEPQYNENGQQQYDGTGQHVDQYEPQYDENGKQQYDGTGQHVDPQYDETGQQVDQYEPQYDENGQQQYDETGQHADQYEPHYDENGQVIQQQQYDESGQHADHYEPQYDENGQVIQQQQYDESGQHVDPYEPQYDENGQRFDENGQHIDQYEHPQQYDENGQPISQYGEGGQAIQQYDDNGQAIQYDENGQPYPAFQEDPNLHYEQYDENGQPIQHYDQQYHENQPSDQQYGDTDPSYGQYDESGQVLQGNEQLLGEEKVDLTSIGDPAEPHEQTEPSEITDPKVGVQNKVLDMLDTDTDSVKQNTSKISNESDFDFGSG